MNRIEIELEETNGIQINDEPDAPLAFVDEETLDICFQYSEEAIIENKIKIRFINENAISIMVENLVLAHLEHETLHAVIDRLLSWEDGSLLDNRIKGQSLEHERLKEEWLNAGW